MVTSAVFTHPILLGVGHPQKMVRVNVSFRKRGKNAGNMTTRQSKKQKRAEEKDKWGYSMSLSRKQRRALRRNVVSRSYDMRAGKKVLEIGAYIDSDNQGATCHRLHGGGSMRYN